MEDLRSNVFDSPEVIKKLIGADKPELAPGLANELQQQHAERREQLREFEHQQRTKLAKVR